MRQGCPCCRKTTVRRLRSAACGDMIARGSGWRLRAYPRGPLHAKGLSVLVCQPRRAGSGGGGVVQLDSGGLHWQHRAERARDRRRRNGGACASGFDSLWKDSQEISQALLTELNRSWALARTPPYHVYLKALHELYYTEVAGGELPLPQRDEELANFQIDAVSRGLAMIDAHGGCYIGGRGWGWARPFIGAELLRPVAGSAIRRDGPRR